MSEPSRPKFYMSWTGFCWTPVISRLMCSVLKKRKKMLPLIPNIFDCSFTYAKLPSLHFIRNLLRSNLASSMPGRKNHEHICEVRNMHKILRTDAFLVACTRLYRLWVFCIYTSLCRSVGPSVCRSVGPSVHRSVRNHFAFLGVNSWKEIRFELLSLPNYYTAPAHPHATDAAVYTAFLQI